MVRTAGQAGRKQPRRTAAAEDDSGDDDDEDQGEEGDDLDNWEDRDVLVETLREMRRLTLRGCRHEIKRIDNQGACGVCKDGGQRLACIVCRVRLCRDTQCWNAHINDGKGRQVSDKIEFKISEDQGKRKEVAGRAREQMEEEKGAERLWRMSETLALCANDGL